MARLSDMPDSLRRHIEALPLPTFEETASCDGPALSERRVALISTAGLSMTGEAPFGMGAADYRVIPGSADASDIIMSHISVNYDRTGYQRDWNVVLPLDRLREMAADGSIGAVADHHYSFMGASDPESMKPSIEVITKAMLREKVDAVLLLPV